MYPRHHAVQIGPEFMTTGICIFLARQLEIHHGDVTVPRLPAHLPLPPLHLSELNVSLLSNETHFYKCVTSTNQNKFSLVILTDNSSKGFYIRTFHETDTLKCVQYWTAAAGMKSRRIFCLNPTAYLPVSSLIIFPFFFETYYRTPRVCPVACHRFVTSPTQQIYTSFDAFVLSKAYIFQCLFQPHCRRIALTSEHRTVSTGILSGP